METKYIHTAWSKNFVSKEDADDIMDSLGCCDESKKFEDFENWIRDQLANRIFAELKSKIQFKKEINRNGIIYSAWLCWFDEKQYLEDIKSIPRNTRDVKKYLGK